MEKDVFTYMIGGKAGQGIKKAGIVAADFFTQMKREVFQMNDYPSLIRGGHNFTVVSTSKSPIKSHYMKADLIVALDQRSYDIHKDHLTENGMIICNADKVKGDGIGIHISSISKKYENHDLIEGVSGIAILTALLKIDKKRLDEIIKKEYGKGNKDNLSFAHKIFDQAGEKISEKITLKNGDKKKRCLSGSEAIALGAAAAGLDLYFAYPMTPATPVLHFFAEYGKDLGVVSIQPENEIAVANMAIGACVTGAKSMIGTSGGGFCLMQEAFSLAGMTEAPVLFYLSQRPGPSTGVPTYTEQADLLFTLYPGQGEFPRIVASPGTIEEAYYLTGELLHLIWNFQTPGVLLSDKHLSESSNTSDINLNNINWAKPHLSTSSHYKRYKDTKTGISPLLFPPSPQVIKWNSYEHDEFGFTTEKEDLITKMHMKRYTKLETMIDYLRNNIKMVNVYGQGPPYIFTFGSTTMSVLEALNYANMTATVVQPIYLQPFPEWELEVFGKKDAIVVEQNSTGQLEQLLTDKIRINPVRSIRQFNGRPFDPIELGKKLMKGV